MLKLLQKAARFGDTLRHILVTTADPEGVPHLAVADRLLLDAHGNLTVTGVSCPAAAKNVAVNRWVSLVLWDAGADLGYQIVGEVVEREAAPSRQGSEPDELPADAGAPLTLRIQVKEVFLFSHTVHTDRVLGEADP